MQAVAKFKVLSSGFLEHHTSPGTVLNVWTELRSEYQMLYTRMVHEDACPSWMVMARRGRRSKSKSRNIQSQAQRASECEQLVWICMHLKETLHFTHSTTIPANKTRATTLLHWRQRASSTGSSLFSRYGWHSSNNPNHHHRWPSHRLLPMPMFDVVLGQKTTTTTTINFNDRLYGKLVQYGQRRKPPRLLDDNDDDDDDGDEDQVLQQLRSFKTGYKKIVVTHTLTGLTHSHTHTFPYSKGRGASGWISKSNQMVTHTHTHTMNGGTCICS